MIAGALDDGGDRRRVVAALGDDADERGDQALALVVFDELRRQAVAAGRKAGQLVGLLGTLPGRVARHGGNDIGSAAGLGAAVSASCGASALSAEAAGGLSAQEGEQGELDQIGRSSSIRFGSPAEERLVEQPVEAAEDRLLDARRAARRAPALGGAPAQQRRRTRQRPLASLRRRRARARAPRACRRGPAPGRSAM